MFVGCLSLLDCLMFILYVTITCLLDCLTSLVVDWLHIHMFIWFILFDYMSFMIHLRIYWVHVYHDTMINYCLFVLYILDLWHLFISWSPYTWHVHTHIHNITMLIYTCSYVHTHLHVYIYLMWLWSWCLTMLRCVYILVWPILFFIIMILYLPWSTCDYIDTFYMIDGLFILESYWWFF